MDEKQKQILNEAISQLSEEDQLQIAGGGKITEEQCKKIQRFQLEKYPSAVIITGYAASMPYQQYRIGDGLKKQKMSEEQKTQDIVPTDKP